VIPEAKARLRAVDHEALEITLMGRAEEHSCELVVERLDNGLWRASFKTIGDDTTPAGAIRLSAARPDRDAALQGLYDAGAPR
jgi:hypothetical protein